MDRTHNLPHESILSFTVACISCRFFLSSGIMNYGLVSRDERRMNLHLHLGGPTPHLTSTVWKMEGEEFDKRPSEQGFVLCVSPSAHLRFLTDPWMFWSMMRSTPDRAGCCGFCQSGNPLMDHKVGFTAEECSQSLCSVRWCIKWRLLREDGLVRYCSWCDIHLQTCVISEWTSDKNLMQLTCRKHRGAYWFDLWTSKKNMGYGSCKLCEQMVVMVCEINHPLFKECP